MSAPRERLAAVDIGSSAIKYAVYDVSTSGTPPILVREANPVTTALGRGLELSRPLPEAARRKTLDALARFAREIGELDAEVAVVIATQAVRIAGDGAAFMDEVRALFAPGVAVRVISNEEEARLSYVSACAALPAFSGPTLNLDPGGSSIDFAYSAFGSAAGERTPSRYLSLHFGMNKLAAIAPPERDDGRMSLAETVELATFLRHGYAELASLWLEMPRPLRLIATSGALIAIAAAAHGVTAKDRQARSMATHGTRVTRGDLERLIDETRGLTSAERRARHPAVSDSRAPIFVHGCLVYLELLRALGLEEVLVNGYGLKYGALIDAVARRAP
jgi:exopolyphosphatase / guanosine-5'-triphosphate,3'-diphosphate pyrophosphatase